MVLKMNTDLFLYDISSLLRAFFPGGELAIESESLEEKEDMTCIKPAEPDVSKKDDIVVVINQDDFIQVSIIENGNLIYDAKEKFTGDYNPLTDGKEEVHKSSPKNQLRREYKNAVKRLLYQGLCQYTKKSPAWGILTGVRPTKLAMEEMLSGKDEKETEDFLCHTYLCSREKARLAAGIAGRECGILNSVGWQDMYSLYIGIPFCPSTCNYCSFASYSLEKFSGLVEDYLSSLYREISAAAELMKGRKLCCVYFGGGTPTSISAGQLDSLLEFARKEFPMENVREFTVEAGRPDSITSEKLKVLKKHQVSRISINPQTMKDETLKIIGRKHNAEDIKRCFNMARSLGFDNINMDIIAGLPGETVEDVENTLREIQKMNPDSLTVHSMVLKRAARLNREMTAGEGPDSESINKMVDLGYGYAAQMGLSPYYMYRQKNARGSMNESRDNIGYARENKEGIYNVIIMEEVQTIVALGAGSITKRVYPDGRIERCENVKDVAQYIKRIGEMIERKRVLLSD